MPAAPIARPSPAATTALAATTTRRAGRAVNATASVPCCTSEVNSRVPATMASIVDSRVDTTSVLPSVNGRCSYGSVLTTAPSTTVMATPMSAVIASRAGVERSERSLIHSLRVAARTPGRRAVVGAVVPAAGVVVGMVIVVIVGSFRVVVSVVVVGGRCRASIRRRRSGRCRG